MSFKQLSGCCFRVYRSDKISCKTDTCPCSVLVTGQFYNLFDNGECHA